MARRPHEPYEPTERASYTPAAVLLPSAALTGFLRQMEAKRRRLRPYVEMLDAGQTTEQLRATLAVLATAGDLAADIATMARLAHGAYGAQHTNEHERG